MVTDFQYGLPVSTLQPQHGGYQSTQGYYLNLICFQFVMIIFFQHLFHLNARTVPFSQK